MPIRTNLESLRRLDEFLRFLGGRYTVVAEVTEPSRMKLDLLEATGRPFFKVTAAMRQAVLQEWKRNVGSLLSKNGRALNTDPALALMASSVKSVILRRFTEQGFDISLRHLSPHWSQAKRRRGLDPRIGIATGVLYRNLQRARFVMRKVSTT
jgi:hypothetical protein